MEKIQVKLRYFGRYDGGVEGEMFQAQMPDGKVRYIGCYTWGKLISMCWLCDAPYGYCEADYAVDTDKYELVWCDAKWNECERPLPFDWMVEKVKRELIDNGTLPAPNEESVNDLIRRLFKEDSKGENYVENALYCHWDKLGKPQVVHKFKWCGLKCYIMKEERVHHDYDVKLTEFYVQSEGQRLRSPFICKVWEYVTEDFRMKHRKERFGDKPIDFSNLCKADRGYWYVSKFNGWGSLSFTSFKVYRAWCKEHGLRPIIPDTSEYKSRRVPFEIKELKYTVKEMPEGFTPYPVMSNGDPRMGGYKVEGNTVYVYRPNPNYAPVWDGIYDGVNYGKDDDDYAFRAFHRFRETHVTL